MNEYGSISNLSFEDAIIRKIDWLILEGYQMYCFGENLVIERIMASEKMVCVGSYINFQDANDFDVKKVFYYMCKKYTEKFSVSHLPYSETIQMFHDYLRS